MLLNSLVYTYVPLWYVRQWTHIVGTCYLCIYTSALLLSAHIAYSLGHFHAENGLIYMVCPESDDTSILFCSSLEPSPYFHFLL